MTQRRKAKKIRYKVLLALTASLLAVIIALIAIVVAVVKNENKIAVSSDVDLESGDISSKTSSVESTDVSSEVSSEIVVSQEPDTSSNEVVSSKPDEVVAPTAEELDADFGRLLLINGSNPLPEDYDTNVRQYLVEIDPKYRNNNNVTKIHKDVYPYITAMVAAAQADGVNLKVWSPFRDYATQKYLFQNQVNRVGGDEVKAATVVARPGTSEHNTGLCADFNMADDKFESTPMYTWMCQNAENYGFILRYPQDKQHITGVIYESWHWRFVGINNAKEINKLGVTLEEYIEMKGIDPTVDMYTDD